MIQTDYFMEEEQSCRFWVSPPSEDGRNSNLILNIFSGAIAAYNSLD